MANVRAEIIAVGTELLVGQIVNTNARYLSEQLNAIGVDVYYHTVVGDNAGRLRAALETAAARSDLVLVTGGLGPTQDDITKDILAELTNRTLEIHEAALEKIRLFFEARGTVMTENNERQAYTLSGAEVLPNDNGMAIGVALIHGDTRWMLLPGPPRELVAMYRTYAEPWILKQLKAKRSLYSTTLKFSGIGESRLENELIDLVENQSDPTIALYAKDGEVAVRLSTKASGQEEASKRIQPVLSVIRERVGEYMYADRDIPLEQAVVEKLIEKNQTLAVAESCTGGLVAELMTSIPGSSRVFVGGIIAYAAEAKIRQLGVARETIEQHGTVSEETARQMAIGCILRFGSDYAISVTGVAGPDPSEGKPPGTVFVSLADRSGTQVYALQLSGDRDIIRLRAAKVALYHLWRILTSDE